MQSNNSSNNTSDAEIWELARKRADFKYNFSSYIIVNAFLWIVWYMTGSHYINHIPWPLWPTLGWGIGVLFHYLSAYVFTKYTSTEREYRKLVDKKNELN